MNFDRSSQHADELHFVFENMELLPGNFKVYLFYRYKSTNPDANFVWQGAGMRRPLLLRDNNLFGGVHIHNTHMCMWLCIFVRSRRLSEI